MACATLAACGGAANGSRTPTSTHDSTVGATTALGAEPARDTAIRDSAHGPTLADTLDPAVTLRAYLERARTHRATGDTLIWEPPADSTTGFNAFTNGTLVSFSIGTPGPIEGAAGSRYVTIPFTAVITNGATSGEVLPKATLRRAVVDGATDVQRRWRIVRIDWSVR